MVNNNISFIIENQDYINKCLELMNKKINSIEAGQTIWQGHSWYDFDEYDMCPSYNGPTENMELSDAEWKNLLIELYGRNKLRAELKNKIKKLCEEQIAFFNDIIEKNKNR